jgi:3-dehydroquinate dehydratase-2
MGLGRDNRIGVVPTVTLARVYERQGLLHEAAKVYRSLLATDPGRSDVSRALKNVEERLQSKPEREEREKRREERLTWETETVLTRLERWQQGAEGGVKGADHRPDERTRVMVVKASEQERNGEWESPPLKGFEVKDLDSEIQAAAKEYGILAQSFQSSEERDLIWKIEDASASHDVLVIDPGDGANVSKALREVLLGLDIPIIEVHLFNFHGEGPSGSKSLTADVATAHLAGFGMKGFTMALEAATGLARRTRRLRELHPHSRLEEDRREGLADHV